MDDRLRILFLAFYFPPTGGGGVERTLQFARRLPGLGIDVEMLVPTDAKWLAEDPAGLARIPPEVRVHRVPYRGPSLKTLPGERIRAADGRLERLVTRARLVPQRLLLPDANLPWLADVVPAGRRLLATRRFDAVLTTAPPHSVAIAGRLLRGHAEVPWIADWRDPWLTHADLDLTRPDVRAKQAAIARIARWCVAGMDAASAVDPADVEIHDLRPDLPVAVIPNGVDLEEIDAIVRHPDPEHLTLTFTGWFFGERSPAVLLEAASALLAKRPDLRDRLRLRFVGGFPGAERERVDRLDLGAVVSIEPPVGHGAALQAQADADVGLLFMQDVQSGAGFRPAKSWELLASGRPILAVVPPGGAAAAELAGRDAEIVAPGDVAGAQAALERLVARWTDGTLVGTPLDEAVRARISRQVQAEALADLIRSTLGRG